MSRSVTVDELIGTGAKTAEQIDALFTTLASVSIQTLQGIWRAVAIPGVSPQYQLMIEKGWYGMRLTDQNSVDSLLIANPEGTGIFAADLFKLAAALPANPAHLSQIRSEIETDQPTGRLRLIDYRGTVSAAMIYDRQPVIDYFRTIDDTTVLCTVEARDITGNAYLILQRTT